MFSDVGHIYAAGHSLIGEAETADARLQMQRRAQMFPKKNKKQKDSTQESAGEYVYDPLGNTIAMDAIYDFLTNLVRSTDHLDMSLVNAQQDDLPSLFDTVGGARLLEIKRKYAAAKAANAYEHAAHTAQNARTHRIDQSNKSYLGLQNVTNSQLYSLIKDVDTLRKRGVDAIAVPRKSSFLESLLLAVEEAKAL